MNKHGLQVLEFDKIRHLLAGFASSALGRRVAEKMLPLNDGDKIIATVAQTTEMREVIETKERFPIGGLQDIRPLVKKMHEQGHPLEPAQFRDIYDTLRAGEAMKAYLRELGEEYPGLVSLSRHVIEFPDVCNAIEFTIDRRGKVCDSASSKLTEIRRKISDLQTAIRQKVEAIVSSKNIRGFLQQEVFTIRDGRCVLLVRAEQKYKVKGIIHDMSQTGATAYIEPEALVRLGNELSDLLFEERNEVTRLLWDITFKILEREADVRRNLDVLAWIDFTYAKAQFSIAYGMNPPEINDDGYARLREARHPLLLELELKKAANIEEAKKKVVPLTAHVGDDFEVLVITGPNTGGKTVVLKTFGLLSAMALCGMHIPAARGSEIAVFHDIYADIGDEQSLEQSLSTFSSHMINIVRILNAADDRSLVLIDEMGSGTDPAEGAALGTAILDYLYNLEARTIVTTHLGVLKSYAYSRPRAENASMEFDARTLQPTFKMTIGMPGSSNAISIARRLGMLAEVIGEAEELMSGEDTSATQLINEMQASRMEMERMREDIERIREETGELKREYQQKVDDVIAKKETLTGEADAEIDAAFNRLKDRVEGLLAPLRNAPRSLAENALEIERAIAETLRSTPLAIKRREYALHLKKGEYVYVPKFRCRCLVKRVDKKRERIIVMMGSVETEVPFDDLTWVGQH